MRRPLLALPLLLLAFSGCGADDEQPATGTGATDTTRLEVVVTKAGPTQRLEFSCGGDSRPCDAAAIAATIGQEDDYEPVETDGAARAAALIAPLLEESKPQLRPRTS